jgi:hypothetical protein
MRAALLIALKDVRILLRDRMALFWVFVFPVGFALFFGSIMKAGVDADVTPMTVVLVLESKESIAGVARAAAAAQHALGVWRGRVWRRCSGDGALARAMSALVYWADWELGSPRSAADPPL